MAERGRERNEQWQTVKGTTERLWDSTRRVVGQAAETAASEAGRYRKVVGGRIDAVSAEHRMRDLHAKLGRAIHEALMDGGVFDEVVEREEVRELLGELDTIARRLGELAEEIEAARSRERANTTDQGREEDVEKAYLMALEEEHARGVEEELHL